MSIIMYYCNY